MKKNPIKLRPGGLFGMLIINMTPAFEISVDYGRIRKVQLTKVMVTDFVQTSSVGVIWNADHESTALQCDTKNFTTPEDNSALF